MSNKSDSPSSFCNKWWSYIAFQAILFDLFIISASIAIIASSIVHITHVHSQMSPFTNPPSISGVPKDFWVGGVTKEIYLLVWLKIFNYRVLILQWNLVFWYHCAASVTKLFELPRYRKKTNRQMLFHFLNNHRQSMTVIVNFYPQAKNYRWLLQEVTRPLSLLRHTTVFNIHFPFHLLPVFGL